MVARILDGAALAQEILTDLKVRVATLTQAGVRPGLGTILVGDDGPSARYVAGKHADCAAVGMASFAEHLPATATMDDVLASVRAMNENPAVHGYIVQYPVPDGLDFDRIMGQVDPSKDADGLHPVNLGLLAMGERAPLACTPRAILALLARNDVPVAGKHMVIVGRGLTIGRPLAMLAALRRPDANAAVTVVHTGVSDIGHFLADADIIVAAAGSPSVIKADQVKPGAAVIGAGVTMKGRKVVSDVADDVAEVAGWVTPRLGGVGPITRAMLLLNTVEAAEAVTL